MLTLVHSKVWKIYIPDTPIWTQSKRRPSSPKTKLEPRVGPHISPRPKAQGPPYLVDQVRTPELLRRTPPSRPSTSSRDMTVTPPHRTHPLGRSTHRDGRKNHLRTQDGRRFCFVSDRQRRRIQRLSSHPPLLRAEELRLRVREHLQGSASIGGCSFGRKRGRFGTPKHRSMSVLGAAYRWGEPQRNLHTRTARRRTLQVRHDPAREVRSLACGVRNQASISIGLFYGWSSNKLELSAKTWSLKKISLGTWDVRPELQLQVYH